MTDPTRALVSADQLAREYVGKGERSITSPHNSTSRTLRPPTLNFGVAEASAPRPRNGAAAGAIMT